MSTEDYLHRYGEKNVDRQQSYTYHVLSVLDVATPKGEAWG